MSDSCASAAPIISALYRYPVKGCRGVALEEVALDRLGPEGDRRFMIVDADGRFLSQRSHPAMALIEAELEPTALILRHAAAAPCRVLTGPGSVPELTPRRVSVWKSTDLLAEDAGDEVAAWLSDLLHTSCRLVRAGDNFLRTCTPGGDPVSFADAYPLLIASEASLADLNDRLQARREDALPMDRFRPNLVVRNCAPFAEDTWLRVRIGEAVLRATGPCARCSVTTTDQRTGIRSIEPLRTLATYRRDPTESGNVNFGQNLVVERPGLLRVGDRLELGPLIGG